MSDELEVWASAVEAWQLYVEEARKELYLAEESLCYYGLKLAAAREKRQLDHEMASQGTEYFEELMRREQNG